MRRMTLPIALLVSLGVIVLAAAILFAMGRLPICKCGYVRFWGPADSQHLFDSYTFTHVLHGPVFYLLIWLIDRGRLTVAKRLVIAVFFEAGWEIVENTQFIINRYQGGGNASDYTGDTIVNSIGDMAAMIVGFLITSSLPVWVTAILFVSAEVALYIVIQDSLTLNFIGLILGRSVI
jgi:Protein of unknown function (DUF2585)